MVVKKTTTAAKPAAGLSVTGNKKIGTLMKEFNKQFPYLRLCIAYSYARDAVKKGDTIYNIDIEKTLASVRRADSSGSISISGNKKIKSLEKEFDTVFGLYVQVCYTDKDGHRYYTSGSADEKTLASFNAECEKNGCKKGIWNITLFLTNKIILQLWQILRSMVVQQYASSRLISKQPSVLHFVFT